MKNNKNVVIKKGRHSRKPLSGIYNARCCKIKDNSLLNRCVEDPRYQPSGMTPNLMGFTLRSSSSRSVSMRDIGAAPRGFTLIELLVVVLIIGILAAVAVPQYQKAVLKSRFATVKEMAHSLANAEELYYLANGKYTIDFGALDISLPPSENEETNGETDTNRIFDNWRCHLHNTSTASYVYCSVVEAGSTGDLIGLQLYLRQKPTMYKGQWWCVVGNVDLTSLPNQVCKSETKQESPSDIYSGATWNVWVY